NDYSRSRPRTELHRRHSSSAAMNLQSRSSDPMITASIESTLSPKHRASSPFRLHWTKCCYYNLIPTGLHFDDPLRSLDRRLWAEAAHQNDGQIRFLCGVCNLLCCCPRC